LEKVQIQQKFRIKSFKKNRSVKPETGVEKPAEPKKKKDKTEEKT
jgi:hypothetical protein